MKRNSNNSGIILSNISQLILEMKGMKMQLLNCLRQFEIMILINSEWHSGRCLAMNHVKQ